MKISMVICHVLKFILMSALALCFPEWYKMLNLNWASSACHLIYVAPNFAVVWR